MDVEVQVMAKLPWHLLKPAIRSFIETECERNPRIFCGDDIDTLRRMADLIERSLANPRA